MVKLNVLHMYPDLLNLYGDGGNMEILKYRCAMRNIECQVDKCDIDQDMQDFSEYDMIYLGGGADLEQNIVSSALMKSKDGIRRAYENGAFLLMICGGYQLMGQFYRDSNGTETPGVGLFSYYTTASTNKSARCIGNIIIDANLGGMQTRIIGFENHGGMTEHVETPLGKVLYGNGNVSGGTYEGYFEKNVIATYLHGPLLSKNPAVADYIIQYCMERKLGYPVTLPQLDDTIEEEGREVMFQRLLKENAE